MESTFSLDCRELFCLQTRKPRRNVQTILHSTVCAKQHRRRASSHLICTQSAFATSAMISGAMSVMGVFFGKHASQWKQSMKYFTTVSQQMSTAIRHVVKDSIVFQRKRKDVISTFPVLQGSAPLLRRGGKLYHLSCLPPSLPASCEMFPPKIIEIQLGILDSDLRTPGIIAIGHSVIHRG